MLTRPETVMAAMQHVHRSMLMLTLLKPLAASVLMYHLARAVKVV